VITRKKRNAANFVVISVIFPSEASTVVWHSLMFLEIAQSFQECGVCVNVKAAAALQKFALIATLLSPAYTWIPFPMGNL
jgi:hypothetical protein